MYSKISVIGEGRAGKTSLIYAMLGNNFKDHESTVGVEAAFLEVVQHNVHGSFSGSPQDTSRAEWRSYQPSDTSHGVAAEAQAQLIAAHLKGRKIEVSPPITKKLKEKFSKKKPKRRQPGPENTARHSAASIVSVASPLVREVSPLETETQEDHIHGKLLPCDPALIDKFIRSESNDTESLKLLLEDFGGQDVFYDVYSILFSEYGVYILVFNMKWFKEGDKRKDEALGYIRYWLSTVAIHTNFRNDEDERSFPPIFLVGTHKDEIYDPNDHQSIGATLERELNGIPCWRAINTYKEVETAIPFFPINNKVGIQDPALVHLMQGIQTCVRKADHLKQTIPFKWMELMDEFEKMKMENKYAISLDEFQTLCKERLKFPSTPEIDPDLEVQIALEFFDKLGIIMYQTCTPDLVLIHPAKFLFPYITKIICDYQIHSPFIPEHEEVRKKSGREWKLLKEKGILSRTLLSTLWKNCQYVDHIENLMVLFGLMVPVLDKDAEAAEKFLVPSILPKKTDVDPENLPHSTSFTLFALFSEKETIDVWKRHSFVKMEEVISDGFLPQGVFSRLVGAVAELCQSNPPYDPIDLMSLFQNFASFTLGAFQFTLSKHQKFIKFRIQGISAVELTCNFEYFLTIILEHYMPGLFYVLAVPVDGGRQADGYRNFTGNLSILNGSGGIIEREMKSQSLRISETQVMDASKLRQNFRGWLGQRGLAEKYDFFFSYRWGEQEFDSNFVMNMFLTVGCREYKGRAIAAFLDKRRLEPGSNFVNEFCNGLFNTKVAVPVISIHALEKMLTLSSDSEVDNLLLEWTLMLEMIEHNGCALKRIFPVIVGKTLEVPTKEGKLMTSFYLTNPVSKLPDCVCSNVLVKAKDILKRFGLKPSQDLENRSVRSTVKSLLDYLGVETWELPMRLSEHHSISHRRAYFYRVAAISVVDTLVQNLESVLDVEDNAQRTERSVEIANVDLVVNAEKLVHPNEATTDNAAIEPTKQGSNSENNSKCCCILQ